MEKINNQRLFRNILLFFLLVMTVLLAVKWYQLHQQKVALKALIDIHRIEMTKGEHYDF